MTASGLNIGRFGGARLDTRCWGPEAAGAKPFPGANRVFSSRCSAFSPFPGFPGGSTACSDLAPSGRRASSAPVERRAKGERPTRNAYGQIPPSRIKASPSRTKKTGLDFLGFLRSIRVFSSGYEQSELKILSFLAPPSCAAIRPAGHKRRQAERLRSNGTLGLLLQGGGVGTNIEQSPYCQENWRSFCRREDRRRFRCSLGARGPRASKSDDVRFKLEEHMPVTMIESRHQGPSGFCTFRNPIARECGAG